MERSGPVWGVEAGMPLLKGGKEGWGKMELWIKQGAWRSQHQLRHLCPSWSAWLPLQADSTPASC